MTPFAFQGFGGTSEIGASSHLITLGPHRILIDAGARPNERGFAAAPALHHLGPTPPSAALLTHAHLDHIGTLPLLTRVYPELLVHCTEATALLAEFVLLDAAHIQQDTPIYSEEDVRDTLRRLVRHPYAQPFSPEPGLTVTFYPAGHLPGAAQILLEGAGRRVVHAGDVNNVTTAITPAAYLPVNPGPIDALILESTYGDTQLPTRAAQTAALIKQVDQVLARGGKVLIPSFALGRAQELSVLLGNAIRDNHLRSAPIYLDGMTRRVTRALEEHLTHLPEHFRYLRLHKRVQHVLTQQEIQLVRNRRHRDEIITARGPAVVIASSGMLSAGVSPHYARAWLRDPRNALLLVGHQEGESPGAKLLALRKGGILNLPGENGQPEPTPVLADITRYHLSGHADRAGLVALARAWNPRHVVLVHGEHGARDALARSLQPLLVSTPRNEEVIPLDPDDLPADTRRRAHVHLHRDGARVTFDLPADLAAHLTSGDYHLNIKLRGGKPSVTLTRKH